MPLSRRDLITSTAALPWAAPALSTILTAPSALAQAATWQFPAVIDVAFRSTPILAELKRRGVSTILRYYAYKDDQWDGKLLTAEEARAIHDRGIAIAAVYQYHNNVLANLNPQRAKIDAEHSIRFGGEMIKQPTGSALYFGVDGDWPSSTQMTGVYRYFDQIKETFAANGNPFRIGVYGSGKTCKELKQRGLAELFWLPLSTGWTGTRDFYNSKAWTLYQNAHEVRVGNISLDTNWANPTAASIGAFDSRGLVDLVQHPQILIQRRFVATATDLRKGPGSSHPRLASLPKRKNVSVLGTSGDWASADVNEDGRPEGFCIGEHLSTWDTMP